MPQSREVVITGLGVVCPIGVGCAAYWAALEAGQSGVDWLPEMRGVESPFRYAARVKAFDPKQFVQPRKTIKVMCQEIQTAYAAAGMAMEQARLAKGAIDPDRLGIVLGSEMLYGDIEELREVYRHCTASGEFRVEQWGDFAFKDLFPLWMLKYLPNMAACHISIAHDARGPNNSIVEGGASSLLAIGEATAAIQRGHADVSRVGTATPRRPRDRSRRGAPALCPAKALGCSCSKPANTPRHAVPKSWPASLATRADSKRRRAPGTSAAAAPSANR
jgi:3-oxoacyl-[acyl-carrier-protein] synthase II